MGRACSHSFIVYNRRVEALGCEGVSRVAVDGPRFVFPINLGLAVGSPVLLFYSCLLELGAVRISTSLGRDWRNDSAR